MPAFVTPCLLPSRPVAIPTNVSSTCRTRRRFATSCAQQQRRPDKQGPKRRIRVPREQTYQHHDWQWHGSSEHPPPSSSADMSNWTTITIFKFLHALHKSGQTLTQTTAPLLTKITALGARVFRSVTDAIGRVLRAEVDYADLTVEYGIAEPCPNDKTFVDPLKEWDLASSDPFYRDLSGNAVYLQLHGPSGLVASTDFRDCFHDFRDSDNTHGKEGPEPGQPQPLDGNSSQGPGHPPPHPPKRPSDS